MLFKNALRVLALVAGIVALAPAGAQAKIIEMGETDTRPEPACPRTEEVECFAVSRTTGYQNRIGAVKDPFVVPRDGRIVAWTLILADPTNKETNFFTQTLGGEPSAGISILAKPEDGEGTEQQVVAASAVRKLTDYLGKRVQFPLVKTLRVERGQRVALTVPTWAPALAPGFPSTTGWRASRAKDTCDDTSSQTAMTALGNTRPFQCYYKTARLTYTVTLITEPKPKREKKRKNKRPAEDPN